MNVLEFKRKLMTEPNSPELRAARAQGGEFEQAGSESDRFEALLQGALNVKAPEGLSEQIILNQAVQKPQFSWRRPRFFAIAAAVTMAVALTSFNLIQEDVPHSLADHLAYHWQHDGNETMLMASTGSSENVAQASQVFSALGLEIEPQLMASLRLVKFCPSPDGQGAHIVMNSDQGLITLFYMPRTQVAAGSQTVELADGMQALTVNLERGSLALIASSSIDKRALISEISEQMSFPAGHTL